MRQGAIARYINPWAARRDQQREQRLAELRARDGDTCSRCRRPLSFDLPSGHPQAPTIERIRSAAPRGAAPGGDRGELCLCHARCNWAVGDTTAEVIERLRRKASAAPPERTALTG